MNKQEFIFKIESLRYLKCFNISNEDMCEIELCYDKDKYIYKVFTLLDNEKETGYCIVLNHYFHLYKIYWREKRMIGGSLHHYRVTLDEILENVSESVKQDLIFNLDVLE